jgi:transcriptional regulator with XRE-family HTH domain
MSSFERKGSEIMTTLGKEIKKARIDKGLKQKDLMKLTGLTQKHLSLIENDDVDPGVSVLRKIVLALGVSADQLLGITQEELGKGSGHEHRAL